MYEEMFPSKLAELRMNKGVLARDMILSIGQNPSYINNIETGKALPSMSSFFYICEFLNITPQDFFIVDAKDPELLHEVNINLKRLSAEQLRNIAAIVKDLAK